MRHGMTPREWFVVSGPHSLRRRRIGLLIVAVPLATWLGAVVYHLLVPSPCPGYREDVREILRICLQYEQERGRFPGPSSMALPFELRRYEFLARGDQLYITGWDGERVWTFRASDSSYSLGSPPPEP